MDNPTSTTAPPSHAPSERSLLLDHHHRASFSSSTPDTNLRQSRGRGRDPSRRTHNVRQRSRRALNRAKIILDKTADYLTEGVDGGGEFVRRGPECIWEYQIVKWMVQKTGVTGPIERAIGGVEGRVRTRLNLRA